MRTTLKERRFTVKGRTKLERMGVGEGVGNIFPEELTNEMGFEDMM